MSDSPEALRTLTAADMASIPALIRYYGGTVTIGQVRSLDAS